MPADVDTLYSPMHALLPQWFRRMARRIDGWIVAHPGEPFPVPARVRRGMVAGQLLSYLALVGVNVVDGELPRLT